MLQPGHAAKPTTEDVVYHSPGLLQILELMEGGDLRNALSGLQRDEMTWYQNGQHLALDIIRGICYLHNNRVIHGDLKVDFPLCIWFKGLCIKEMLPCLQ